MAGEGSEPAVNTAYDERRQGKPGSGYRIVPGTSTGSSIVQYSLVGDTPGMAPGTAERHGARRFGSIPAAQGYMEEHGLPHYVKPDWPHT